MDKWRVFVDDAKEIEEKIDKIIREHAFVGKLHASIREENFENLQIALRDYILSLLGATAVTGKDGE